MTLNNCTFAGNLALNQPEIIRASSGSAKNSIFSGSGTFADLCDGLSSGNYNLQYNGTCFTAAANDISADPQLDSLADNGGWTWTHALPATSPAVDAADNTTCETTDQRGVTRPVDGDGDLTATCDMGAFEFEP